MRRRCRFVRSGPEPTLSRALTPLRRLAVLRLTGAGSTRTGAVLIARTPRGWRFGLRRAQRWGTRGRSGR